MACYDAIGGISMSNNDEEELEEEEPSLSPSLSEESMWQINLRSSDAGESGGPYPERPGEADCSYYIRTGLCRFGATCRFNHPPNRKLAIANNARMQGDQYPQRIGQPECQYYLMTGSCKFGGTCKFHHPRDKAGIAGRVPLNNLGYPIRPNEVECAYYLRTGQCKFGNTCKFHHPQPVNMMVSLRAAAAAAGYHSPTNQQSYIGGAASWSRGSTLVPSPRWHGPSSYAPLVLPQTAVVSLPGWNAYSSQLGPASSSSDRRVGNTQANYGTCSVNAVGRRTYYGLQQILQRDYINNNNNTFPERPEQPECQFYMKTGDCKFGAVCKFHHPRHRCIPPPDCLLSSIGLPLRPGEPICIFYSRYGICKFGPSCKFDHPMGVFANSNQLSAPGSPAVQLLFASSPSPSPSPEEDEEEEEEEKEGQHLVQAGIRQRTRRMSVSSETMLSNSDNNFNTNQGMSI